MSGLRDELAGYSKDLGIDLFGVADLTTARDFILRQGGEHIASFPLAISMGTRLLDAVIDELYRHEEPSAIYGYSGHYESVNANLDRASMLIAKRIQDAGFKAYPQVASQYVNMRRLEGAISHKLVANLAGLGWIGRNCLLITPGCGPRLRLVTVLTDAPLEAGRPIPNGCGDCRKCVDVCPVNAITGTTFDPSEPRDVRLRAHLCREYTQRREQRLGVGLCALCVYVCPHGLKKE